jgi:hypothetical protein
MLLATDMSALYKHHVLTHLAANRVVSVQFAGLWLACSKVGHTVTGHDSTGTGRALELDWQKDNLRECIMAELSNLPSCYSDLHQTRHFSRNVQTVFGAHTASCSAGAVILPGGNAAVA